MIRIFPQMPQKGMPISMRGIAEGLRAMAKAWETLSVEDGTVQWNSGSPRIVFTGDTESDSSGTGDLPPGGEKYQVLQKQSSTDGDAVWDWVRWPEPESE
jgi:hypothetical protein